VFNYLKREMESSALVQGLSKSHKITAELEGAEFQAEDLAGLQRYSLSVSVRQAVTHPPSCLNPSTELGTGYFRD
jgi:hypothetical protein